MTLLGPDFSAGLRHALYRPYNPAGLWTAVGILVVLLLVNQVVLQSVIAAGIAALISSDFVTFRAGLVRGALLSVLPAGLLTAYIAFKLARRNGADPVEVLALRPPALGLLGWVIIVGGFPVSLVALFGGLAWLLGIDLSESGMVEEAVMQASNDPWYFLVAAGLIIGAPLAEELTFRGQIFSALSQTRMGTVGASVVTSALWAALHAFAQPPLHAIALLFLMGLALCWLLVRFGSLWVTIACHAAWNAISAVTLYSMSTP